MSILGQPNMKAKHLLVVCAQWTQPKETKTFPHTQQKSVCPVQVPHKNKNCMFFYGLDASS